jgi:hypothetical protein
MNGARLPQRFDAAPFEMSSVDVSRADRVEFVMPLMNGEDAGLTPDSWPQAVRDGMRKVASEWIADRRDRKPIALAFARIDSAVGPSVVTIIFHVPAGTSTGEDDGKSES